MAFWGGGCYVCLEPARIDIVYSSFQAVLSAAARGHCIRGFLLVHSWDGSDWRRAENAYFNPDAQALVERFESDLAPTENISTPMASQTVASFGPHSIQDLHVCQVRLCGACIC